MAKVPSGKELATKLCGEFPKATTNALGRMLYEQNKERFPTQDAATQAIRRARGNHGDKDRKHCTPTTPKPNGPAEWRAECPPSAAEPWGLINIPGPVRLLSLSDIHCPYHEQRALEAAVAYGRTLNPDVLLLNGDTCDFYRISRFQQDPKQRDFKFEIETCKEILSWLRGQFPDARFIFKLGNHEDRWDHYIWNKCVELWNLENLQLHNVLDFEKFGIERVDDNIIMAGELPILHGHELGRGISSPVNPARGAWMRGNHTILIGHYHRASSHPETDILHNEMMAWSQGCLCNRRPKYARTNKWQWGFAFVDVDADNQFNVHNFRISNDYAVRTA